MSNNDLAVQLHFALFNHSGGFLLKPPEMLASNVDADSRAGTRDLDNDLYWPPARDVLQRTVIEVISLHNCPKVCEKLPFSTPALSSHLVDEVSGFGMATELYAGGHNTARFLFPFVAAWRTTTSFQRKSRRMSPIRDGAQWQNRSP